MKPSRQSALHIPQDALEHCKMRLSRVVHEKAHLLNCVGEVRTSQREVLQGASEAAVLGGILHRSAIRSRELGTSVHRTRCRVTLGHAGTLEQIHSVLVLREEEAVSRACDRDPEEVMKAPRSVMANSE